MCVPPDCVLPVRVVKSIETEEEHTLYTLLIRQNSDDRGITLEDFQSAFKTLRVKEKHL